MNPASLARGDRAGRSPGARDATGSARDRPPARRGRRPTIRSSSDPNEAYRTEVTAGAEGRDARPQQLARHRPDRMADDRRAGQRRSAAAGAGRQRRRARASSGCADRIWPISWPGRSRATRRSSGSRCGCSRIRGMRASRHARMRAARLLRFVLASTGCGPTVDLTKGLAGRRRRHRLVRRRHRQRPEQARPDRHRSRSRTSPTRSWSTLQVNALFRRVTENDEWGSGFLTVGRLRRAGAGRDDRRR